jgi:hypothetical protein
MLNTSARGYPHAPTCSTGLNEHRPRLVFSSSGMPAPPASHRKILMAPRHFSMTILIVLPRFVEDLL